MSRQQRGQHGRRRRREHRLLISLLLLLAIRPLLARAGGGAAPPRAAVAVAMGPWLHAATAAAAGRRQGPRAAFWVSAARYGSSSTCFPVSRRAPWCLLGHYARQQQQQHQRPRRPLQPFGQPGTAYGNPLASSFSSSTTALSAVSGKGVPSSPPHPAEWLLSGVQAVKGVGPSAKEALKKLGITTVLDLLLHLPVGIFDWGELKLVREMQEGETVAVAVRITGHNDGGGVGRRPLTIYTVDAEGQPLDLIFFLAKPHLRHFYLRRFPPNSVHKLAGRASRAKYTGRMTLSHPEAIKVVEGEEAGGATDGAAMPVEPVYRLTSGLNANKLRDFQREALRSLQALAKEPAWDDWLDQGGFLQGKGWPSFHEALRAAHSPATLADLEPTSPARARLAFDELLATQLPTALRRAKERAGAAGADGVVEEEVVDGYLTSACESQLPFTMTAGQRQAVQEIWGDLATRRRGGRMVRLLQGDVGSGKTVCAVLAMLRAVELGGQAALLAPTEILAFQHQQTVEWMCAGLQVRVPNGAEVTTRPLRVEVLTSSKGRGKARRLLLESLKAGEIDVLVGTHALLGDDVVFNRLGLVVIDEEHRFGVRQRERLSNETSVLYMSATPIPRTLLLSSYGDVEVSRLEEAPSRDVTVITTIFALTNVGEIAQRLHKKLLDSPHEKVFWVLPCIDGDGGGRRGGGVGEGGGAGGEGGSVMSVVRRYEALVALMGEGKVRMVHGRMDGTAKLKALQDFADGAANVLVSTSVIEVGVDVPAATVCIVEHAELFGLSQLHQLRGRIGRATTKLENGGLGDGGAPRECYCVLTYDDESPGREKALQRLMTLKHTTDGFEIAEQDLRLRGPGEIMGSRQSGHTGFRLVDLVKHADLLEEAHALAQTHALRMTSATGGDDDASLYALLRLFSNNEEGAAPSVTTKSKAASAVSSSTAAATTRATRTRGGAAKGETVTTMTTTTTTSTASTSSLPPGATPFPPSSVTTVVSVPSQLEGWTTSVYGDRYEVYSPPPPPEEDGLMDLAALAARTRAAAVASSFAVTTTTTTTKGPNANGNGDAWGSFYPQPEVPRVAIDLEAVDTTFVLFDLETTGLNAERERIIQVAAKVLGPASWGAAEDEEEGDGDAADLTTDGDDDPLLFNAYVNPGFEVPAKITEITGISTALLLQEGARPFEQVWPAFCQWLDGVRAGKPVVLVAHNAAFDHKMLAFDLRRCGWDAARAFRGENGRHLVGMMDTLAVFRSDELWSRREGDGLPPKPSSFKQESLYRYLIGRELRDAHNARGDVMGLEALLSHPFVRRKWRGVGSASVLEMGGWVEGVDDVVVVGDEAEAGSKKAPVVLEGSSGGGGGSSGGPGLSATRPSAGSGGGNGGSGRSGGYDAAAASSGAGANKKGMMAMRRRATEDGAAC